MYKIGDFILCKKEITIAYNNEVYYKKGKFYKLMQGRHIYEFLIESDYVSNWYFDTRKQKDNYIGKYFLSETELRKEKLKKLYI